MTLSSRWRSTPWRLSPSTPLRCIQRSVQGQSEAGIWPISTVWLAYDQLRQQQVVLKILKADASKDNKELSILLQLSGSALEYPGKNHLMNLLDHFEHHSPNGTHLCLVLLVMISDGEAVTITGRPHYAADIQEVSRQILLGLDFLHTSDIIHCDLQPANITFSPDEDVDLETLLESSG
ncbi:kinase-like domain-containing protein [Aspergillus flavus]|uniref:non-specific serine/threonine protein kinase n=1 Tax=Aspergillus flavus TaxID=5059 RepID=A0A5N6GPF4_ASPFL|nr:kinase-like domain-containing protein [Aspergillus flavus]